jgi:hypothetical protein
MQSMTKKPVAAIFLSIFLFLSGVGILVYGIIDMKIIAYYDGLENKDLDAQIEEVLGRSAGGVLETN